MQVSYPKLKAEKGKARPESGESETGTYVIEAGEEEGTPTRQDIAQIISNSPALSRPELRRELRQIIQTFINKHSSQPASQSGVNIRK